MLCIHAQHFAWKAQIPIRRLSNSYIILQQINLKKMLPSSRATSF